jgi:alkylation response protein AidB-like acyl-CoA dehydrogenase
MIELDPPLRVLRDRCREAATDLRGRALAVDADPAEMTAHLDSATLAMVRAASTPKRFQDVSGWQEEYTDSCLSRAVASLELAHGDAGLLCANTGPGLAGIAVDALGSEEQQELFYETIADGRTWTFFAMTEDGRGSDATAMQTRLAADGDGDYRLTGTKRYVGNGVRGAIGVVFARTGPTALSIRGALVRCPTPGFTAEALEMMGLRGARISALDFDGVHVPREMLLGSHLPASRRGIWGASRTFNVMRVQIAAMALGVANAAHDYVREQRPGWSGSELITARLAAGRALLYAAAAEIDATPDDRRRAGR